MRTGLSAVVVAQAAARSAQEAQSRLSEYPQRCHERDGGIGRLPHRDRIRRSRRCERRPADSGSPRRFPARRRPGCGRRDGRHLRGARALPQLPLQDSLRRRFSGHHAGHGTARPRGGAGAVPARLPDPARDGLRGHGPASEVGGGAPDPDRRRRCGRRGPGNRFGCREARRQRDPAARGAPPDLRSGAGARGHWNPGGPVRPAPGDAENSGSASQAARRTHGHHVQPSNHRRGGGEHFRARLRHGVRHRHHKHRRDAPGSGDRRGARRGRQRQSPDRLRR